MTAWMLDGRFVHEFCGHSPTQPTAFTEKSLRYGLAPAIPVSKTHFQPGQNIDNLSIGSAMISCHDVRSILCIIPVGFLRWLFVLAGWHPGARRIAKVIPPYVVQHCLACFKQFSTNVQPIVTDFNPLRCAHAAISYFLEVTEWLQVVAGDLESKSLGQAWSSYVKLFAHCF